MINTMLVVADDKIVHQLFKGVSFGSEILIVKDKSVNIVRVLKLLLRKSLPISAVFKMIYADFFRRKKNWVLSTTCVKSNSELFDLYKKYNPRKIILFRAGLIIKRDIFPKNLEILNLHCASLDKYGGLASIYRAISNKDYSQNVNLHRVTNSIDKGEIISKLSYKLSSSNSYLENEDIAYKKGFELLLSHLKQE